MKEFRYTNTKGELRFNCPKCGDTKFHLYINAYRKIGWCHHCHYTPTKPEVLDFLKGVRLSQNIKLQPINEVEETDEDWEYYPFSEMPDNEVYEILKLLGKEKLDIQKVKSLGLGVDMYGKRAGVVVPIIIKGTTIGYSKRCFLGKPKYFHSGHLKTSEALYQYDNINTNWVILVEGVFDSIWTPNSVAVFGHYISDKQVDLLLEKKIKKVIVLYDSDVSDRELIRVGIKLGYFLDTFIARLEQGDPYENSLDNVNKAIREAVPLENYITGVRKWKKENTFPSSKNLFLVS